MLPWLALLAACGTGQGGADTSCVGPYIDDQPPFGTYGAPAPTVNPGQTLPLYGHWYTNTCNDTGGHDLPQPLPPTHLTVSLPGGYVLRLGPFTPHGKDMGFHTTVQLPAHLPAGPATISDDRSSTAIYEFMVGRA